MLLLLFEIANKQYGINSASVVEIIPMIELQSLESGLDCLAGSFEYRGNTVPVIDLTQLIVKKRSIKMLSTRLALMDIEGNTLGLIAEKMTNIIDVEAKQKIKTENKETTPYLGPKFETKHGVIQTIDTSLLITKEQAKALFK